MGIYRVSQAEKDSRSDISQYATVIDLFKNRPLGIQDKEIGLHFEMGSRRMYGNGDNVKRPYRWENISDKDNEWREYF
jgi:hypothetical protein